MRRLRIVEILVMSLAAGALLKGAPGLAQAIEDADIAALEAEASPSGAAQRPVVANRRSATLEVPSREENRTRAPNIFAAHSWYTPPPPRPARPPVPPPPPTAPPLPFTYVGSFQQDGVTIYYLVRGDQTYDVKIGDVLDGKYSVDGIDGDRLMFTYLPLEERQVLPLGAAR